MRTGRPRASHSVAPQRVIITADDFGLAHEVNEAVEQAHRDGVLSAASLMVAASAAGDAVERARRMPRLGVGLHLVLVDGAPTLPAREIPDLVDGRGWLRRDLVRFGIDIMLRRRVREQLAREIEAQFEVFRRTGLALDHVNAHKHFYLHPVVSSLTLAIGRRFGLRAVRVPHEPAAAPRHDGETVSPQRLPAMWVGLLRRRVRRRRLCSADQTFGNAWSGAMTTARLRVILSRLPAGSTEIYLHPATRDRFSGSAPGYRYGDELAALLSPEVARALRAPGIALCRYADLPAG